MRFASNSVMLTIITQLRQPQLLPLMQQLLDHQTVKEWQWLVVGEQGEFSSYEAALEAAQGEVVIHFDEDAYYAPSYLEQTVYHLRNEPSCIMGAWFGYDLVEGSGLYWSSFEPQWAQSPVNYEWLYKVSGIELKEIAYELAPSSEIAALSNFTYSYRKGKTGTQKVLADRWGSVVRLISEKQGLAHAPYFRLPPFLFEKHLPHFMAYLQERKKWSH